MPKIIATIICILLILYLFWVDRKKNDGVSKAIWIPFIWMFLAGSRYVSQWLNLGAADVSYLDFYMEGSPLDRTVFLFLTIASIVVLIRRRLNWGEIFKNNYPMWLFFILGLISILWSDYPFVSFKRWFKTIGSVSMVLVILTEVRPYEAFGVILKRLAFLLLPLSILFIKYYPELGRDYTIHGKPMYIGVTVQKNSLGELCLVCGIYLCWNLFFNRREGIDSVKRLHFSTYLIILTMIAWLLYFADSATSLTCLVVAICLFLVGRLPPVFREPHRIMIFCVACIVLYGVMELAFDVRGTLINMLGRSPDLTTRVPAWEGLLIMDKNPILGYGWQSFWMGERGEIASETYSVINAHNGYLEVYLHLGLIGLFFLLGWILSGLIKVWRHLVIDYPVALLRFCFLVVIILYNWTEATLFGISNMFIIFLLGTMDVPGNSRLTNPYNGRV